MNRGTKIILAFAITALISIAIAIKLIWFPSVKEAWFQANGQRLRQVPSNLVIVRPTHFPKVRTNTLVSTRGKGDGMWMSGRNVTFKQLMASAYGFDIDRVVLPSGAPKDNFDFLVTTDSKQEEGLRTAVIK